MKSVWYDTIAVVLIVVTVFSGAAIARVVQNSYTREGVVTEINSDNEEVFIVDTTGNEWCFYGVGYTEGDTVIMTMDKHNTDNIINDDIIKSVTVNNN